MSDVNETETEGESAAPRRLRRASRYQRAQSRKAAQKASDHRFYNMLFAMMGAFALLVILLGAIMMNGVPEGVVGMAGWTSPWVFGLTKLEVAGYGFVAFITLTVGLRLRKKR